jgi:hypothetical protein
MMRVSSLIHLLYKVAVSGTFQNLCAYGYTHTYYCIHTHMLDTHMCVHVVHTETETEIETETSTTDIHTPHQTRHTTPHPQTTGHTDTHTLHTYMCTHASTPTNSHTSPQGIRLFPDD